MSIILIQDILRIIFEYCPITDKRNLIRTCKLCYKLSFLMSNVEKEFQNMINSTGYLDQIKFTSFDNLLYKYTIELIYDGYAHLIPNRYVIPENRIMHYYDIYYRIAKKGNIDMLNLMLKIKDPPNLKANIKYIVKGAARGGHKSIIEWIIKKYKVDCHATQYAAKGNHFELLKWLYKNGFKISKMVNGCAVKTGNMEMIKWVFKKNNYICGTCVYFAVKNNNVDLLQWFYDYNTYISELICDNAVIGGKIEIVKWCLNRGLNYVAIDPYSCHIEMLEWLKKNNYITTKSEKLSIEATHSNKFETLKWAYENGFLISPKVCEEAALVDNIEILKWYRKNIGNVTIQAAEVAIKSGRLEILKWILKKGIKMNADFCGMAAWYGHFDILKWLYKNNCPWNSITCESATHNGHFSILKWVYKKGCPLNTLCCANTACFGHVEILKWLREKGCEWDDNLGYEALSHNSVYIIEWAKENGYRINPKTYRRLMSNKTQFKNRNNKYFFNKDELVE